MHKVFPILMLFSSALFCQQKSPPKITPPEKSFMPELSEYTARDFSYLLGKTPGLDSSLLETHFTLYRGYVKNANLLISLLREYVDEGKERDYPFQAIKRRLGWEWDGMRLHELYFENLGGKELMHPESDLYRMIVHDFGSYDLWKKDYIATGLMRGIGWSILYYDPQAKRLFNMWINEHALNHLAGGTPVLVMDVWEHAYMPQYGLNRRGYINAFFKNIDWDVVMARLPEQKAK